MLFFKKWYNLITEGQNEDQALIILQNDQNILNQLKTISPESKYLPALAFFYLQHKNLNNLQQYFTKLQELVNKRRINYQPLGRNGVKLNNDIADNWLKFTEIIDGLTNLQQKKTGKNDGMPIDAKPIFHNDRIDVYEANSPQACVKYGQGYGFCISQPGGTMWQSYRDTQGSTFYFVFDRTKDKSDPLHIVVVDITTNGPILTDANNKTGKIAEFGTNANAYLDYLKSLGVPKELFKNMPKSPEEQEEEKKLGKENKDLNWFTQLSPDYKSKYIGRGHALTNEQFNLLWNNKAEKFLQQYVNIGKKLNDYQMDKVFTNNSLKNSYLRQRLIANEHTDDLSRKEFDQISPEDQQKIKNKILSKPVADAITQAASQGFTDIVKLLIDKINSLPRPPGWAAAVLELAMRRAAEKGHKDTVELLLDKVSNIDWAVTGAAANGHKDVLEFLLDKGSTNNLEAATHMAVVNNHKDIFELLISKGVKDFRYMIKQAAHNGQKDMVELMLKYGDNLNRVYLIPAIDDAAQHGHKDIVELLRKFINQ